MELPGFVSIPNLITMRGGRIFLPRVAIVACTIARIELPRATIRKRMIRNATKERTMASQFAVGIKLRGKTDHVFVEAEDALVAALKVKIEKPDAIITYVRRTNRRGDARHLQHKLTER